MIWLLGTLLALLAIGGLATPWWWTAFAQRRTLKRRAANITAYRTRLQELEADLAAGVLAADAADAARGELAARLLSDAEVPAEPEPAAAPSRRVPLAAALALLAFGLAWYAAAGSWRTQALVELARTDPEAARQASVNQSIARLRERVEDEPGEFESWVWLARSYRTRGSYEDAVRAFARANELRGHQDPDLLVEEGEAIAFTQNRTMAGAPAERFEQALALAPGHPQALWYGGIAALQAGDAATAVARWERLRQQDLPADMRSMIDHSLAQLRERSGIRTPPPVATAQAKALALDIDVSVAPEIAGQVQPGAVLYVYAQDPSGPPMPLAVQRLPASGLPARVTLDDSMSPMPTRKLSSVDRWRLVARISKTGSATPQPGDLEGSLEVSRAEAKAPVRLVITRKLS
ncbi:MAG: c-type cytochrome biogenesis protein CcmI [Gammaproteobacteria bacterium]